MESARELSENGVENSGMVNEDFEPAPKEEDVLEVFKTDMETVNPMYLREQTELGKGDINTALTRLTSAGWVRKVTRGLYKFVEDPREEARVAESKTTGKAARYDIEAEEPTEEPEPTNDTESPDVRGKEARYQIAGADDSGDDLGEEVADYVRSEDIPPKTNHGRSAALDVFDELREAGTLKTSELQARVFEGYEDQWSDERTMWNAIDRHLEKIPGVQKGGYGEWEYAGDDEVRAKIGAN